MFKTSDLLSIPLCAPVLLTIATLAPASAHAETGGIYAGAGFIPRFAILGGGYYRVAPDFVAEAEAASGSYSLKFNGNGVESSRLHITARGRYFLGSSFNLSSGLAYDRLTDKSAYDSIDAQGKIVRVDLSSTVSQVEFELGIGNRWTLGAFLIGCDWFGVGVPLVQLGTSTTANDGATSLGKKAQFESDAKSHAKDISYHFLKLHLGYAF
jgi:hypothetical protein